MLIVFGTLRARGGAGRDHPYPVRRWLMLCPPYSSPARGRVYGLVADLTIVGCQIIYGPLNSAQSGFTSLANQIGHILLIAKTKPTHWAKVRADSG